MSPPLLRVQLFLGLWLLGWSPVCAGGPPAGSPSSELYARATNTFVDCLFFKPAEPKATELNFALAPLILQEVRAGRGTRTDSFGEVRSAGEKLVLEPSRLAIYVEPGTVRLNQRDHICLTYTWFYSADARHSNQRELPAQGVRITLDAAGNPAIWEVLADRSGNGLIFVAQSVEAAAAAQYGPPLPGRHYAVERSLRESPSTVAARVIDDGPMPMGPIVYLRAGSRSVSTLICRCMPAQAKHIVASQTYDLLPAGGSPAELLLNQAKAAKRWPLAFATETHGQRGSLEQRLRLPKSF